MPETGQSESAAPAEDASPLPVEQTCILTPLPPAKIEEKLLAMSQRGKLPGFERVPDGFVALAYGWVYDFDLVGAISSSNGSNRIGFSLRVKPKMPWIIAAVLALSVFPGVWITDSMIAIYFDWYPTEFWKTCVWYLPLSILPIPWVWKTAMNRSRTAAEESGRELIERIAAEVGGAIAAAPHDA